MTETGVFRLALRDNHFEENIDFPQFQKDAVNVIAQSFTDIIYETKQKSSTRKSSVLKFLNSICEVKQLHNEKSLGVFLNALQTTFNNSSNIIDINYKAHQTENVIEFHNNRNNKYKQHLNNLEYIRKWDQEKLDTKLNLQARKNPLYLETNQDLIRKVLGSTINSNKNRIFTINYREKQIKCAYSLLLNDKPYESVLENILQNVYKYGELEAFELNFLLYLWKSQEILVFEMEKILVDNFYFIIERIILEVSKKLLSLTNESEVSEYFSELHQDKSILKIQEITRKYNSVHYKLRSLLHELYCFSVCNGNILRLYNYVFK